MKYIEILSLLKTKLEAQGFVVTEHPFIATLPIMKQGYCLIQDLVHEVTNEHALSIIIAQQGEELWGIIEQPDENSVSAVLAITEGFSQKTS